MLVILAKGLWHRDGGAGRCPHGRKKPTYPCTQAADQTTKAKK